METDKREYKFKVRISFIAGPRLQQIEYYFSKTLVDTTLSNIRVLIPFTFLSAHFPTTLILVSPTEPV